MKISLKRINYISLIKYSTVFLSFCLLNNLEKTFIPYSNSLYSALLYIEQNSVINGILLLSSLLVFGKFDMIYQSLLTVFLSALIKFLYKKFNLSKSYEFIFLSIMSVSGFLILGKIENSDIIKKIITAVIMFTLSTVSMISLKALSEKGVRIKYNREETLSILILAISFGVCISNLFSPYVYKGIMFFSCLMLCYLFRFGIGSLITSALSISLSVYYNEIDYIAVFLIIGITADLLMSVSRYLSALLIIVVDFIIYKLFNIYGSYSLFDYLPNVIASALFCIMPTYPIKLLKEKLYSFREKQLIRQTINRNRIMLSNKLYELSGVFMEMASAFNKFGDSSLSEDKAKSIIEKELLLNACASCENKQKCRLKEKEMKLSLSKLIDIGFAKGKLSIIDIPKEIINNCLHPNDIIFGLNKMLSEFRSYELEYQNVKVGRSLIAKETLGVADILKGLALESGTQLKYQSRLERYIFNSLSKKGLTPSELLIYGENERLTVSMIITAKEYPLDLIIKTLSKTIGKNVALCEKNNITENKVYLTFKIATEYDAVFGVSSEIKDGSDISGDTHSVIRISDEKFLIAISDGMGSGNSAESVSSVSLSLIESFYKAGMNSELILDTVNKLLSINSDDNFTALDISIIDLKNLTVDFIKYGSPYGFILSDGAIKIIEGNSLPLGIIDDLKPSVCHTKLNDGDIILLTSDGISDAFKTSSDFIDYLRLAPTFNPQTLSDEVIKKALTLSNNKKNDDMTALAVRIYKRA